MYYRQVGWLPFMIVMEGGDIMLEELIKEGHNLQDKAEDSMVGKFFDCVEFEKWAAQGVSYLEQQQPESAVTERVIANYKKINSNTNYSFYKQLLGALEATV